MSGYLTRLALRAMGLSQGLSPRVASRFEEVIEEPVASPGVQTPGYHGKAVPEGTTPPARPLQGSLFRGSQGFEPLAAPPVPHRRDAPWGVSPRPAPSPQALQGLQVVPAPQVLQPPQPRRPAVVDRSSSPASETPHGASLQWGGPGEVDAPRRWSTEARSRSSKVVSEDPITPRHQPAPEPVIRVSIGRIEVRAVQPAAPQTAAPARPAASASRSSLDDYLARRREGS